MTDKHPRTLPTTPPVFRARARVGVAPEHVTPITSPCTAPPQCRATPPPRRGQIAVLKIRRNGWTRAGPGNSSRSGPHGWVHGVPDRDESSGPARERSLCLVGGLGFEPRLAESESAVLPLDDPPPDLAAAGPRNHQRVIPRHGVQRLEYCGPRRALRRPTFLRSTSRASRVTKPALRSGERSVSSYLMSARAMP